jgi:hypothetical protein
LITSGGNPFYDAVSQFPGGPMGLWLFLGAPLFLVAGITFYSLIKSAYAKPHLTIRDMDSTEIEKSLRKVVDLADRRNPK